VQIAGKMCDFSRVASQPRDRSRNRTETTFVELLSPSTIADP